MNCKDPKDWKTKNPMEDVRKFELVRNHNPNRGVRKRETIMWDYSRCTRLPDGYYFSYPEPDIPLDPAIFIIEIENYSRVDEEREMGYFNWWSFFDGIEYTALHIMEFNRFGEFQRDILKESWDERESTEILKSSMDQLC